MEASSERPAETTIRVGNGYVRIWYEESKSTFQSGSNRVTVGAEANVLEEDIDKAIDQIAQIVRDLPVRVRSTTPRIKRVEMSTDVDEEAEHTSKRPRMPRNSGRNTRT